MGKILFIAVDPADADCFNRMCMYEERDLLYTAAMLKEKGHDVLVYENDIKDVDFKALDEFNPDIICLSIHTDLKIIEWAKSQKALVTCCANGFTSSDYAREYMQEDTYIDFIFTHYMPFHGWAELLDNIDAGKGFENIKGIMYRQGNEIKENKGSYEFDVNNLKTCYPIIKGAPAALVTTSVGCTGKCTFCSHYVYYNGWHGRRIDDVISDIRHYTDDIKEDEIALIRFADEAMDQPDKELKRLKELCEGIIGLGKQIYYTANFRPNFSGRATPEIMELLVKSGLYSVFVGVESGCQADLNLFKKQCTVEEARETVKLFRRYGISVDIGFIMFHPFSTLESISQNIDLLEDLGLAGFEEIVSYYRYDCGPRLAEGATVYKDHGVNNWLFKDTAAGNVFLFMYWYLETLKKPIERYEKALERLGGHYSCMQFCFRNDYMDDYIYALDIIQKIEAVRHTVSMYLCRWARKLIEISRAGFDGDKAVEASVQLINEEIINGAAEYIERINKESDEYIDRIAKQAV